MVKAWDLPSLLFIEDWKALAALGIDRTKVKDCRRGLGTEVCWNEEKAGMELTKSLFS